MISTHILSMYTTTRSIASTETAVNSIWCTKVKNCFTATRSICGWQSSNFTKSSIDSSSYEIFRLSFLVLVNRMMVFGGKNLHNLKVYFLYPKHTISSLNYKDLSPYSLSLHCNITVTSLPPYCLAYHSVPSFLVTSLSFPGTKIPVTCDLSLFIINIFFYWCATLYWKHDFPMKYFVLCLPVSTWTSQSNSDSSEVVFLWMMTYLKEHISYHFLSIIM